MRPRTSAESLKPYIAASEHVSASGSQILLIDLVPVDALLAIPATSRRPPGRRFRSLLRQRPRVTKQIDELRLAFPTASRSQPNNRSPTNMRALRTCDNSFYGIFGRYLAERDHFVALVIVSSTLAGCVTALNAAPTIVADASIPRGRGGNHDGLHARGEQNDIHRTKRIGEPPEQGAPFRRTFHGVPPQIKRGDAFPLLYRSAPRLACGRD